jgi:hypothetical protein
MLIDVHIQSRINPDDIIVFKNGKWENIHKGEFLGGVCNLIKEKETALKKENEALKEEIKRLEEDLKRTQRCITSFQEAVDGKLEEYHNVLNALTGAK